MPYFLDYLESSFNFNNFTCSSGDLLFLHIWSTAANERLIIEWNFSQTKNIYKFLHNTLAGEIFFLTSTGFIYNVVIENIKLINR